MKLRSSSFSRALSHLTLTILAASTLPLYTAHGVSGSNGMPPSGEPSGITPLGPEFIATPGPSGPGTGGNGEIIPSGPQVPAVPTIDIRLCKLLLEEMSIAAAEIEDTRRRMMELHKKLMKWTKSGKGVSDKKFKKALAEYNKLANELQKQIEILDNISKTLGDACIR